MKDRQIAYGGRMVQGVAFFALLMPVTRNGVMGENNDYVRPRSVVTGMTTETTSPEEEYGSDATSPEAESIDLGSVAVGGNATQASEGSFYLYDVQLEGDTLYAYALLNATRTVDGNERDLAVAQCDSSFSTTCTAISIVKYNTKSCAGPTQTSGCTGWAQQTQRGYKWDVNSEVLFTSYCSSDVLGAYRTLTMKKYAYGIFEGDYTVSKQVFGGFKFVLAVTCT
jgi:hypothetical protein